MGLEGFICHPIPFTLFILFTRYDRIADKAANVKKELKKGRTSFISAWKGAAGARAENEKSAKEVQKNAKKRLTSSDGSCIIQLVLEIS